jgi:hypothetical protein
MSLLTPARNLTEAQMRSLRAARDAARHAYDTCVDSRDTVWLNMPAAYESRRAELWHAYIDASMALREAGA